MLNLACPTCRAHLQVPGEYIGARYTCSHCGYAFKVPMDAETTQLIVAPHRWMRWVFGIVFFLVFALALCVILVVGAWVILRDVEPDAPTVEPERPIAEPKLSPGAPARPSPVRPIRASRPSDPTGDGPPSVTLEFKPTVARPGEVVTLIVEAEDDLGLGAVWFFVENAPDDKYKGSMRRFAGGGSRELKREIQIIAPPVLGEYKYVANAQDSAHPPAGLVQQARSEGKSEHELRELFPGLGYPHQASGGSGLGKATLTVVNN